MNSIEARFRRAENKPDGWEDEDAPDVEEVMDILDAYTPPFCYLGMHEGDGALMGVWVTEDTLDEAVKLGMVWVTDQPPTARGMMASVMDGRPLPDLWLQTKGPDHKMLWVTKGDSWTIAWEV